MTITSRRNPAVQLVRAVARGVKAAPEGLCFVEGIRLAEEWLRSGLEADTVLVSDKLGSVARGAALLNAMNEAGHRVLEVADGVLDSISNVRSHQGIAAAVRRPEHTLADVLRPPEPLIAVAAGVQDPGNVGTIVRTAHAAGASGVVVLAGGASPFNAKAIRASAGSALHLPVVAAAAFDELVERALASGVRLLACDQHAEGSYLDADLAGGVAVVLGQEGSGLADDVEKACDARMRIPMASTVDSLNVAATAAVILFEAARRRGTFAG